MELGVSLMYAAPRRTRLMLGKKMANASLLWLLPSAAFFFASAAASLLGATRLLSVLTICRFSCPLFSGGLFSFALKLPLLLYRW
ncbi:hypothetical protein E2562_007701 [Oryza meyeriana var. granulata]|uniref:Uncharacterized protein n=1 Tax=Oryza meyeriana var. granulata TaxID=110450 RepID=A0A6G1EHG4_9ORYZ|nr:hypothetical protein E2562_007701 [Oryza meyeriana var. granulata]